VEGRNRVVRRRALRQHADERAAGTSDDHDVPHGISIAGAKAGYTSLASGDEFEQLPTAGLAAMGLSVLT